MAMVSVTTVTMIVSALWMHVEYARVLVLFMSAAVRVFLRALATATAIHWMNVAFVGVPELYMRVGVLACPWVPATARVTHLTNVVFVMAKDLSLIAVVPIYPRTSA